MAIKAYDDPNDGYSKNIKFWNYEASKLTGFAAGTAVKIVPIRVEMFKSAQGEKRSLRALPSTVITVLDDAAKKNTRGVIISAKDEQAGGELLCVDSSGDIIELMYDVNHLFTLDGIGEIPFLVSCKACISGDRLVSVVTNSVKSIKL